MKKLTSLENIQDLTEEDNGLIVLNSSSPTFLNNVEDDNIIDDLSELEHSASHFLYDDIGRLKKDAVSQVKQNGLDVIELDKDFRPFTHSIKTDKFHVLISC